MLMDNELFQIHNLNSSNLNSMVSIDSSSNTPHKLIGGVALKPKSNTHAVRSPASGQPKRRGGRNLKSVHRSIDFAGTLKSKTNQHSKVFKTEISLVSQRSNEDNTSAVKAQWNSILK